MPLFRFVTRSVSAVINVELNLDHRVVMAVVGGTMALEIMDITILLYLAAKAEIKLLFQLIQ